MPKKGKSNNQRTRAANEKRELPTKGEGAEYAQVVRLLGDGRIEARCMDNVTRLATIRGSIYRRTRLTPGDWVLVGIRPFQTDRADVLLKYTEDEARQLRSMGLIETLVTDVKEEFRDPEEKEKEEDVNFDDL